MRKRVAIVGGGLAGVTAAWQLATLAREGADIDAVLFEATDRLGGIIETIRTGGFVIEGGPDGWVTEKPWARELAEELGLGEELLPSNDRDRKTWILLENRLHAIPDGMRMMVPTDLHALERSDLFSAEGKAAFHRELASADDLRRSSPAGDESVGSFVERHFGREVLERVGAPLLSGVFGGDVHQLSVRAVMGPFVAMERTRGSLIAGLRERERTRSDAALFTTLRSGLGTLLDRMTAQFPPGMVRLRMPVRSLARSRSGWELTANRRSPEVFDALLLATPVHVTRNLLAPLDAEFVPLLSLQASSSIVVALGFADADALPLPQGFGLLVPPAAGRSLLACTFVDQKFTGRVPPGGRLLRAFIGGAAAERLRDAPEATVLALAREELTSILGRLPEIVVTVLRRWPQSLPQYAVGHLERMEELGTRVAGLPGLHLLGNGYRGVGLPDIIRDARAAARALV